MNCICCADNESSMPSGRCQACTDWGCWPYPEENPVTPSCMRPEFYVRGTDGHMKRIRRAAILCA